MIRHHPPEDRLAAYAAGESGEAEGLLIATHMALCPACRRQLADLEALGGLMLEGLPGEALASESLARTLARLEKPVAPVVASLVPAGTILPRPLRDYAGADPEGLSWRPAGAGLRVHRLALAGPQVWLMRLAPGRAIPEHGHTGQEMVMVLSGGYHDGAEGFLRGDVQISGPETTHRPVADPDGECLCLALVDGRFRLTSPLGRLFATILGF